MFLAMENWVKNYELGEKSWVGLVVDIDAEYWYVSIYWTRLNIQFYA